MGYNYTSSVGACERLHGVQERSRRHPARPRAALSDRHLRAASLPDTRVGRPEVELAFDLQGKMTLALAICHELKSMRPLFVEEPAGEFYHPTDGSVADW